LATCRTKSAGEAQGRIEVKHQRRGRPDRHQDHLAAQIIADLDLFLVFVGRLVDVVVPPGLEEEMAGLARGHRDQPADQRGYQRIEEHHDVADHETDGTDEVQALVDSAVVVVTVVVPALDAQLLHEALDHCFPQEVSRGDVYMNSM